MADVLDLLTLTEGKRAINLPESSTQHDAELAQFITAVSRRIDDLCGPVVARTVTEELHDGGSSLLFLRNFPVLSVTSVTEYASGTPTVLTAESVSVSGGYALRDGVLARRSGWSSMSWGSQVVVTYEAGRYENTAAVDAKFKLAAGSILRRLWAREASAWSRGGDPFAGEGAQAFFDAWTAAKKELLEDELLLPGFA